MSTSTQQTLPRGADRASRSVRRMLCALVAVLLAMAPPASADDFDAKEAAYRAYIARPSLFYRTRGRQRLAQTRDPRVVPIFAQDYARAEDPQEVVRSLLVILAARHMPRSEVLLPAYVEWRRANTAPSDAWLWYRLLGIDLALGGEAAIAEAKSPARSPWLRAAALRALADANDPRALDAAFQALPPLGQKPTPGRKPAAPKKAPPPKKGVLPPHPALAAVPASLLAEAGAHALLRLAGHKQDEAWVRLAERVILLLEDPDLSVLTRTRIARSLARVFGTDNLGLETGPWLRELAAARVAAEAEGKAPERGGANYFFGVEIVGERIAFVIDCSDSMLAPLGPKPKPKGVVTPSDDPGARKQDPDDGLPWDRIHTRFDLAREVLKRSLQALNKNQSFAVVLFGTEARLLPGVTGITRVSPAAIASAVSALDAIQGDTENKDAEHPYGSLEGATNLHGGVRMAFRVRASDVGSTSDYVDPLALEEGCDSLYLLSDGKPSWDDWPDDDARDPDIHAGDPESGVLHEDVPTLTHYGPFVNAHGHDFIVEDVQRLNLFRQAQVHCIALGEADDNLLRRLSKATGGTFERVKAAKPTPRASPAAPR